MKNNFLYNCSKICLVSPNISNTVIRISNVLKCSNNFLFYKFLKIINILIITFDFFLCFSSFINLLIFFYCRIIISIIELFNTLQILENINCLYLIVNNITKKN